MILSLLNLSNKNLIKFVSDDEQVSACHDHLSEAKKVALDLEFDKNLHRYGFNLCLIQVHYEGSTYLIDPLAKIDLQPIFNIIENPEIEKIVFAFGEDLRLLNSLGCYPKNINDLSITTSMLNYEPGSLNRYLDEVLSISTSKSSQLSNWYRRPLSAQQINYAAEDVCYLHQLSEALDKEASSKGIVDWIREENKLYDDLRFENSEINVIYKDKDKKGLSAYQWHILKALLTYRDQLAKKMNKPAFQIFKFSYLRDLATSDDATSDEPLKLSVMKSLRDEKTLDKLTSVVREASLEASEMNLSKTSPAKQRMAPEAYREHIALKRKVEQLKKEVFKPIQQSIKLKWGEHTATFILSNKLISRIIMEPEVGLPNYRKALFHEIADEQGLSLEAFDSLKVN